MEISICIATYNGERYIREQVESILHQLDCEAEIVIVDDASTDGTIRILENFSDSRICIIRHNQNLGVLRTFERALGEATGEVLFLCDQDDVWQPEKVEKVIRIFDADPSVTLVLTNGEMVDSSGHSLGKALHDTGRIPLGLIANLIKNRYQGSVMAFRREVLEAALPFPRDIPMHDAWIGLVNSIVGRAQYNPAELIKYRQHDRSLTKRRHGPVGRMIAQRWMLAACLLRRLFRLIAVRRQLRKRPPYIRPTEPAIYLSRK